MDNIKWLQKWYENECNGDWEHSFGINIETTDNPGWAIQIELNDTKWENLKVEYKLIENTENDWIAFKIENKTFFGYGDPQKLDKLIGIFREIIENKLD